MTAQTLIIRYLDEARMMQVAISFDDQPWCVTVYFAHDNLHNLYWLSLPATRHSTELIANPKVAGTVVLPHNYGDPVRGVSFEGEARLITEPAEITQSFAAYGERYNSQARLQKILSGADPHRLYQIIPSRFVLFDQLNFPNEPRQEWLPNQAAPETLQ